MNSIATVRAAAEVTVTVPNTKKLASQESPRQKIVRRVLRAYAAAQKALGTAYEGDKVKSYQYQAAKLALDYHNPVIFSDATAPKDTDATAQAHEKQALEFAGILETAKPAKTPKRAAPKSADKPARVRVKKPAKAETAAEESAEA